MQRKLANLIKIIRLTASPEYSRNVSSSYWKEQTISLEELTAQQRDELFGNVATILDLEYSDTILDYGCGAGEKAAYLASLGYDVIGADISDSLLAEARQRGLRCSTIEDLRTSGKSFDRVYLHGVFMYVHPRERVEFLRRLLPLVRPGGKVLLLGEPDIRKRRHGSRNRFQVLLAPILPVYQFVNASFWTKPAKLARRARAAGYERCEHRDGPPTITAPDRSHFILVPNSASS